MQRETQIAALTDVMAKFTAYIGKRLPKDVKANWTKTRTLETNPLAKSVYDSMRASGSGRQAEPSKLPGHRRHPVLRRGRGVLPLSANWKRS